MPEGNSMGLGSFQDLTGNELRNHVPVEVGRAESWVDCPSDHVVLSTLTAARLIVSIMVR